MNESESNRLAVAGTGCQDGGRLHPDVMRFSILISFLVFALSAFGELLSFGSLKPDESILVVIESEGFQQPITTFYHVHGGTQPRATIVQNPEGKVEGKASKGMRQTLGDEKLSKDDLFGLEAYLVYLRLGPPELTDRGDKITIGYYRDGEMIGEERLVDKSGLLSGEILEDGRIVQYAKAPKGVPENLFSEIVPPWMLAHRLQGRTGAIAPLPPN